MCTTDYCLHSKYESYTKDSVNQIQRRNAYKQCGPVTESLDSFCEHILRDKHRQKQHWDAVEERLAQAVGARVCHEETYIRVAEEVVLRQPALNVHV